MKPTLTCTLVSLIFILAFVPAACLAARPRPFTLEQVMSAPFPTELTAAPASAKAAWVFNAAGARNIWLAEGQPDGSDFTARQLTSYPGDDGQDLGDIAWLPDASAVVYVRGGDLENAGAPYPNPASAPQGVEQNIWLMPLSGGAPQLLGEGYAPAVSPKGTSVAFLNKGQVWLVNLNPVGKAAQLIHGEGSAGSLRWSPDGSKLAFVSNRGDHWLIAVYDFAQQSVHYLDPSVDLDSNPVWSPDGKQVAFIRIPASEHERIFRPERTGVPWSIRVADVATGVGKEVWKAQEGAGSVFRGVHAINQLLWGDGNLLVFPWERDGRLHLYTVPAGGGASRLLTPGDYIVEDVALTPDRRELVFNSNEDDVDRRHLWKESVTGNRPEPLTRGDGIEWTPVVTHQGGAIILLHSDAKLPARPAVLESSGQLRDLTPKAIPADFPAQQMVTPQPVMLSAADGLRIHAQLFLPTKSHDRVQHPAVVFVHGGSQRQMLLGWHYMGYYSNAYALDQYLVSRGYVVLSINYRGGIGYGLDFREPPDYGANGGSEFKDVEGAGLYLRSRNDVDPNRIGIWGGSWGGYLTALALARSSDLFAAGVDMSGVHNWNFEIPDWVPPYNDQRQPDTMRVAFESSPLAYVKTWRSPVLLIQGDDDRTVPFKEMVRMVEALRQQHVTFQQIVFPDEIHDFLLHSTWLRAYHAASDFFDHYLGSDDAKQ
ncbi:MAG TPA: prolyl oligopeptidase family serine peptidase [Terriglobia bacterium]|nr:prolyl oligopeptidase family serine peptidase [Terriglobia bacterium]